MEYIANNYNLENVIPLIVFSFVSDCAAYMQHDR